MEVDKALSLDSQKILVEVYSQINGETGLRPFFFNFFSGYINIECNKDLSTCMTGEIMEVEVIEMFTADGNPYLYCS